MRFELLQYSTTRGRSNVTLRATGLVTSVIECEIPKSFLRPNVLYAVTDLRFRNEKKLLDAISYENTNGTIQGVHDPYLQSLFLRESARASDDPAYGAP